MIDAGHPNHLSRPYQRRAWIIANLRSRADRCQVSAYAARLQRDWPAVFAWQRTARRLRGLAYALIGRPWVAFRRQESRRRSGEI